MKSAPHKPRHAFGDSSSVSVPRAKQKFGLQGRDVYEMVCAGAKLIFEVKTSKLSSQLTRFVLLMKVTGS